MDRWTGVSFGKGLAFGSASVLRAPNGIPLLPPTMMSRVAQASHDAPIEPIDVILVVRDYEDAIGLSLPWARVVGIAAERASPETVRLAVPAVVEIEGLLAGVKDGDLVLVDGDRAVVVGTPDGRTIAAYQAEKERISPRRRVFLGRAHEPARTRDEMLVRVLASAHDIAEAHAAVEAGADGVVADPEALGVSVDAPDDDHLDALLEWGRELGGKPFTLAGTPQAISVESALRAAVTLDTTIAMPIGPDASAIAMLRDHVAGCSDALVAGDMPTGEVRIAGVVEWLEDACGALEASQVGRILVSPEERTGWPRGATHWLDELVSAASPLAIAVEVSLSSPDRHLLQEAVGLGIAGVIVSPAHVQRTKDTIRRLVADECRAALLRGARSSERVRS